MKLISDWKAAWKLWSVRLNAIGLALVSWPMIDPNSALALWHAMPREVRDMLPQQTGQIIAIALFAAAAVARVVRQPKLEKTNVGSETAKP